MFCCTLLYVHSSIAIILMGKRELVVLLNLSSWCLMMIEWLFLAVPWGCLRFVIVAFLIKLTYYFSVSKELRFSEIYLTYHLFELSIINIVFLLTLIINIKPSCPTKGCDVLSLKGKY